MLNKDHLGNWFAEFVSHCSVIQAQTTAAVIQGCPTTVSAGADLEIIHVVPALMGMQSAKVMGSGRLAPRLQKKVSEARQYAFEREVCEVVRMKPKR